MSNTTHFNTEREIEQWKEALQASGHIDQESLMELESHLLDEIDNLSGKGLNGEEVLLVAQRRIGSYKTISKAYSTSKNWGFAKISLISQAFLFLLTFIALSKIATSLAGDISFYWLELETTGFVIVHSLLQLLTAALVYLAYKKAYQRSQKYPDSVKTNAIAMCSLIIAVVTMLIYTTVSPDSYMRIIGVAPYSVVFSPLLVYIIVLVSIIIVNIKQLRKRRLHIAP